MIMISLNLILSLMFLFMNHPMSMGLTLLIQTILISLITGFLHYNFWFSYILFLIMVGGMLVLFIYMTSIASNEMFNYSYKIMLLLSSLLLLSLILMLKLDLFFFLKLFMFSENLILSNSMNLTLTKFFTYPSIMLIFMMIIYLFITLIAVVKITNIEYGPLRHKF